MRTHVASIVVLLVLAVAGCSSSSDPSSTFTGSACDYSGPSEFDVNSEGTFSYTNESDTPGAGFAVWKFPEGLTSEEIFEQGLMTLANTVAFPFDNVINFVPVPTVVGQEYELPVTFTETGQHGVVCFVSPGPVSGTDYVTMFTVKG
jgi:hypothetical protein